MTGGRGADRRARPRGGCGLCRLPGGRHGCAGPEGGLLGLAGGDPADFDRAKPILDLLSKRVELLGPAGSGARMKLAVNLPLALYWATLAESTFDIDGLAEDLALAIAWDRKQDDTLPLAEAARPLYEAAQAEGLGGFDGASLSRHAASR